MEEEPKPAILSLCMTVIEQADGVDAEVINLDIEDADMDWAAYQEHEKELMKSNLDAASKPSVMMYNVLNIKGNSITVNGRVRPEPGQKLVLSIKGDEAQITRREKARKAVMGGSSANPLLGFDFDGGKAPEPQSYAMETFRERKEAHT